jgi:hypothetical protein
MKKTLITLFYILLINIVNANTNELGKIYTKTGDILDVKISVYEKGIIITNSKIKYFENGIKKKILLSKIKQIELGSKKYEVISYEKEVKTGPNRGIKKYTLLAEIISEGKVKLYRTYVLKSNGYWVNGFYQTTGTFLAENNYLVKGEIVKWISKLGFKKSIKKFFPKCEINQKLKDKIYKYSDIKEVIDLGNKACEIN